ncbi:MAG: SDR family oxidoreductase, partial [Clostridia bacterium]|nr:SDR family oxidoreductase [Clostridia bacterium]
MLLEGRCALVTGGARGMGRSIALTLAAEGADVAVFDLLEDGAREVAAAVRERGRRATYRVVDITDYEAVTGAVGEVLEELGAIHILVNNAGVWTPRPFAESGPREWDRDIRVNLYGVLHCTRAVLPQMIRLGYGKIVSITSEAGRVGEPNVAAYSAAKAGVIGFTKALAR